MLDLWYRKWNVLESSVIYYIVYTLIQMFYEHPIRINWLKHVILEDFCIGAH